MHKNSFGLDSHVCIYQLEKYGSLSHGSVANRLVLLSGCLSIVKCKVCLTICACTSKLRPRYLHSLGTVICMGTTIQKLDSNWLNRYNYTYIHRVLVIDGSQYTVFYNIIIQSR